MVDLIQLWCLPGCGPTFSVTLCKVNLIYRRSRCPSKHGTISLTISVVLILPYLLFFCPPASQPAIATMTLRQSFRFDCKRRAKGVKFESKGPRTRVLCVHFTSLSLHPVPFRSKESLPASLFILLLLLLFLLRVTFHPRCRVIIMAMMITINDDCVW